MSVNSEELWPLTNEYANIAPHVRNYERLIQMNLRMAVRGHHHQGKPPAFPGDEVKRTVEHHRGLAMM